MFNKSTIEIISWKISVSATVLAQVMVVQKNDEALQEKEDSVLALCSAILGGDTTVSPDTWHGFP